MQKKQRDKMWKEIHPLVASSNEYFDPSETDAIIEKIMPMFSSSLKTEYFKGLMMLMNFVPRHAVDLKKWIPKWLEVWSWIDFNVGWDSQWFKFMDRIVGDGADGGFDW